MKNYRIVVLIVSILLPGVLSATSTSKGLIEQYQLEIVLGLAGIACFIALISMFTMFIAVKTILRMNLSEEELAKRDSLIKAKEGEENLGFWGRFWNRFHEAVPVETEESIVTNHEYDGIRELDNRLPSWWLYGFYFTIIFGIAYLFYYHLGSGPTQNQEYLSEMKTANEEVKAYLASMDNLVDENSVVLLSEAIDLEAGKAIYDANCAVCHAADGGGGVGPNFTDEYWIHGGDIKSIFATIKYGVLEKGMISWEAQLPPKKIQQVSSYIFNMAGSTAANPKEPQGELFEREADSDTGI